MKLQIYRVNNFVIKEIPAQIFSCEFQEISHNTHFFKESFAHGCFRINPCSVYCPTTTFCFSKTMSHIFSGRGLSRLNLQTWNKCKFNISNPQPDFCFQPGGTSATELFFPKTVNSLTPLSIFAKNAPLQMFDKFLKTPL